MVSDPPTIGAALVEADPGIAVVSAPEPGAPIPHQAPPRRLLSMEVALYLVLIGVAVVTRFWDLGSRALHHDESLHTYYSWLFATGGGYQHHPLMHGPFLFHANALVYLLFGDSDASSRFMPALFGVALVGLPFLLRGPRHLGRWGALAASALFLISPAFLYYSRYIRHDLYTVVGSLLLFIAIVRYLETPQRRWLVTAIGSIGFLLTNHEIVFAIVFAFLVVLWGALLWGRFRPLVPLHLGAAALGGAILLGIPRLFDQPLPAIPWDQSGGESLPPTRENQIQFYQNLITHPLTIAFIVLAIAFVAAARFILAGYRDPERTGEGWLASLLAGTPNGSVEHALLQMSRDRAGLVAAFLTGAIIFVVLYTSMFTNPAGLATATFATDGTLLYWLGQQDVRRGDQPWFFFLLLTPQYEFLALLLGGAAVLLTLVRAVPHLRAGRTLARSTDGRQFFWVFLSAWFVLIFAGLSYAGEKMPWLIVHYTLPATLLAAALIGEIVERWQAARERRRLVGLTSAYRQRSWAEPALTVALLVLAGGWFLVAGRLTHGVFTRPDDVGGWVRSLPDRTLDRWWLLALPPLAALALLAGTWVRRGVWATGRVALLALTVGLTLLQIHAGWRLAYLEGDTPRDMLIYNQTSPDVTRMMAELDYLSASQTGGKGLAIWYDSGVSWPMQWYLRDYSNKHFLGSSLTGPPQDAAVVLVANANKAQVEDQLEGYTAQEYVLRWHFPEDETYRRFAIAPELGAEKASRSAWGSPSNPHGPGAIAASVADSLATQLDPSGQQRVYRLLMYRDLPVQITGYDYTMYVRNDLVPLLNEVRY
ncbi:MAG: TIGR03663 family protein [Chloroflexota bacterium]|nr:TIGR03663 family protein [Chloroflexota bacterium]